MKNIKEVFVSLVKDYFKEEYGFYPAYRQIKFGMENGKLFATCGKVTVYFRISVE